MIAIIKRYPLGVIMIISLLMLLPHLGMIQTNIMEARNLITAREMVNNGHWIFTTLNRIPRYEKPPLPTWITAFFMMIGGMHNMFLLRLPVVLITLLLVYFFFRLTKYMQLKNQQPLHASLILITSFYIFFAGRDNQWDMYTHAFMTACIFYLFKLFNETKSTTKNIVLASLFFGCSFLSKGPVSLYALFLPFIIAYFIVYRKNAGRNVKWLFIVLLIGLMIGLSWPLYVKYFDVNAATALSQQTQNWGAYEVKPWWHYWGFFTQSGIWTVPAFVSLMYFYMRKRVDDVKAYTFSFLWTICSVILLSLIPEKKMRYLLPVLIPMALNTSFYIEYLIANFKNIKNKFESGLVYFAFGSIGFIAISLPPVLLFIFKEKLNGYIFWYILLSIISLCCGIAIIKGLYKKQFLQIFYTTVLFMCGIIFIVIPLSKIYYTNSNYYSAANLHSIEKKLGIKTYEVNGFEPEIIWDYGDVIPEVESGKIALSRDSLFGLLVPTDQAKSLIDKYKNYQFKKTAVVDLNAVSKNEKGYNERLTKDFYVVRKLN